MNEATKAVFLSYASQDSEVALRLASGLRAAGVEVWLDQEGGLVGGDSWDRKIREQIAACALFVPIISANTQARKEGYFRLEWHLAEERMRLIAKGVPFVVPVSVDGTSERGALVPDAFLAVQWTRLAPSPSLRSTGRPALDETGVAAFVARVNALLGGSAVARVSGPVGPAAMGQPIRRAQGPEVFEGEIRTTPAADDRVTASAAGDLDPLGVGAGGTVETAFAGGAPMERDAPPRTRRERFGSFATGASLAIAAAMAFLHFRPTSLPPAQTFRYTIAGPPDCTAITASAISPDGTTLAMVAKVEGKSQLWLRALDGLETKPIPATEEAIEPFWSPDSRNLGFFAQDKLKKVTLSSGKVQVLCDAPSSRGGSWSREDVIIFANGKTGQVQRVAAVGGVPVDVTKTAAVRSRPHFLPDGRRFLWTPASGTASGAGVFVASLDGKEERRIVDGRATNVQLAPSERGSHLLFSRNFNGNSTMMALPFDAASATVAGEVFPVVTDVASTVRYTVSTNGVLVYRQGRGGLGRGSQISWFDRSGKLLGPVGAPGSVGDPALSPDERRVIYTRSETSDKGALWLRDLKTGRETRLTSGEHLDRFPFWSPQGDRIVYGSTPDGTTILYQRTADGSGRDELLLPTEIQHTPSQWSRDGQFIVFSQRDIRESLWVLPLKAAVTERQPVQFVPDAMFGQISPDGRWMAFTSNKSGRREVYVRPFPSGAGEWPISIEGGQAARWRADGKELFFVAPDGKMMAVPVNAPLGAKPVFEAGAPVALFDTTILSNTATSRPVFHYDVTADGSRFLIAHSTDAREDSEPTLTVVTNWRAGLEK